MFCAYWDQYLYCTKQIYSFSLKKILILTSEKNQALSHLLNMRAIVFIKERKEDASRLQVTGTVTTDRNSCFSPFHFSFKYPSTLALSPAFSGFLPSYFHYLPQYTYVRQSIFIYHRHELLNL
jgi:hypothetical protein